MTRRRAFTLIELLVALSLFAIILPISGWLIYVLLHAQTASANSIADALTRSRFARTFRGDAHGSQNAEVVGNASSIGTRIIFHVDSKTLVSYESERLGLIVRTVQVGGVRERREEFPLAGIQTCFERKSAEGTVAAVQSKTGASAGSVRIEVVVGRDRRLLVSPSIRGKGET
jgi:prepilin-type N-terminal cleavage/methylation domain-containing protein